MSTLARLKSIPESEILEKLKLSYDGLKTVEKELFLDIACFFRRKSRNDAKEILDACGFHPDIGIKVLIQKALINIDTDGDRLDMHDLIQEMGHFIIRGEHPDNPEKHSRVWDREEIDNMCLGDATTENNNIEAMGENQSQDVAASHFPKFISKLKKLRWIHVSTGGDKEGPTFLSNELRYLNWTYYPASSFPDNFHPMNLVVLKLSQCSQKELWRSQKHLPNLKVLELSWMRNVVSTPDFDRLPCLQELKIWTCNKLEEIHPSFGNHRSLKKVELIDCANLRMLPTIFKMEKLELLGICRCHKSLEFPGIKANMESLVELSLNRVRIDSLLSSIGERCTSLISLHLFHCFSMKSIEFNFDGLKHLKDFQIRGNTLHAKMPLDRFTEKVFPQLTHRLQRLDLVHCCLEDGEIPSAIGEMSNLQELNLGYNNFSKLHFSISQLTRLKLLNVSCCKRLLELPQLPSSIAILLANECDSLTDVEDIYMNCKWLWYASLICSNMVIDRNRFLQSMLQGHSSENHCAILQLQGFEIPKGFTPGLRNGSECRLQFPENWCNDFCGFLICAVFRYDDCKYMIPQRITMEHGITSGSMGMDSVDEVTWKESVGDEITWVVYISFASLRHTEWWDSTYKKVSFSVKITTFPDMEKRSPVINPYIGLAVRLVHRKGGSGPTEISTNSSGISDGKDEYTPGFKTYYDSNHSLVISPRMYK